MTLFFHKRAVFPMSSAHVYHHGLYRSKVLHNIASLTDSYDSFTVYSGLFVGATHRQQGLRNNNQNNTSLI